MSWINIRDNVPETDIAVLFHDPDSNQYHVGYWNEDDNCMQQYTPSSGNEGWKYRIDRWMNIPEWTNV